mmetsp:Transcript_54974/g.151294  ORF Transcript_54974/g.151294 Transcript_54974/m.151294 type:complete len:214 (-) Transcript_54974:567-1208(-)|eukprot:3708704-Prymnesium_polylepis.4
MHKRARKPEAALQPLLSVSPTEPRVHFPWDTAGARRCGADTGAAPRLGTVAAASWDGLVGASSKPVLPLVLACCSASLSCAISRCSVAMSFCFFCCTRANSSASSCARSSAACAAFISTSSSPPPPPFPRPFSSCCMRLTLPTITRTSELACCAALFFSSTNDLARASSARVQSASICLLASASRPNTNVSTHSGTWTSRWRPVSSPALRSLS